MDYATGCLLYDHESIFDPSSNYIFRHGELQPSDPWQAPHLVRQVSSGRSLDRTTGSSYAGTDSSGLCHDDLGLSNCNSAIGLHPPGSYHPDAPPSDLIPEEPQWYGPCVPEDQTARVSLVNDGGFPNPGDPGSYFYQMDEDLVPTGYDADNSANHVDAVSSLGQFGESAEAMDDDHVTEGAGGCLSAADEEAKPSRELDNDGIRTVHLLVAAAEAVGGHKKELGTVILVRLNQLVSPAGNAMQRLASYFSHALRALLQAQGPGRATAMRPPDNNRISGDDVLTAFQIVQEISPCIRFAHLTANQAIVEAVEREKRVHVVDFDIMEGIQWPSLMQAFVSRKGGPPHLRLTAVSRAHDKRAVLDTGRRLTAFAASIGQPFSFNLTRLVDEEFKPLTVKVVKGEAVVVNCMLQLPHMPHRNARSVSSFLLRVKALCPRVLTLVEDRLSVSDSNPVSFTARFMETLHHYSALFDSLEAGCFNPLHRSLVERVLLGPRIICATLMAFRGMEHTSAWSSAVASCGFQSLPFSIFNHCQAKLLLGLFNDGYTLRHEPLNGKLHLCWRSTPLIAASVWAHAPPPS